MSNKTKKILKSIAIIVIMIAFIGINIVFAETKSNVKFCDYAGTRRTLKIIGTIINIAKVFVPLLIIITESIALTKAIVSGKDEDLKENFVVLVRKIIAGLVIFVLPSVINYAINNLAGHSDTGFTQCSNCLLNAKSCTIPTTDPTIYEGD